MSRTRRTARAPICACPIACVAVRRSPSLAGEKCCLSESGGWLSGATDPCAGRPECAPVGASALHGPGRRARSVHSADWAASLGELSGRIPPQARHHQKPDKPVTKPDPTKRLIARTEREIAALRRSLKELPDGARAQANERIAGLERYIARLEASAPAPEAQRPQAAPHEPDDAKPSPVATDAKDADTDPAKIQEQAAARRIKEKVLRDFANDPKETPAGCCVRSDHRPSIVSGRQSAKCSRPTTSPTNPSRNECVMQPSSPTPKPARVSDDRFRCRREARQ